MSPIAARHPALAGFQLNYAALGPAAPWARSPVGQRAIAVLESTGAVCALLGAIDAAPSRPPHPALDRYLIPVLRLAVLDDMTKTGTGRVIKQIVEFLGGRHVAKGVPVNVASAYANGSIYALPTTTRGHLTTAQRRAWVEEQIAKLDKPGSDEAA